MAGFDWLAFVQPNRFAKRQKARNKLIFFIVLICFVVLKIRENTEGFVKSVFIKPVRAGTVYRKMTQVFLRCVAPLPFLKYILFLRL